MKKTLLSGNGGYRILKTVHLLAAAVRIGAAVSGLFLLTVVMDENNLRAVHYMDLLIIIPANVLTCITGILFSTFGGWGFFKRRWVTLKYLINLIPIAGGGVVFAPAVIPGCFRLRSGSAVRKPWGGSLLRMLEKDLYDRLCRHAAAVDGGRLPDKSNLIKVYTQNENNHYSQRLA
jgi:hypothetical protein